MAHALDGTLVKLPDRIDYRVIMRVQDVLAIFAVPGDVDLRDALRRNAIHVIPQPPQMLAIGLFRGPKIHGYAVLYDFVLLQDFVEDVQRTPAIDHEILGNNLEPIADRLARQNMVVVRRAQANPDSIFSESVKAICGHSLRSPEL